MFRLVCLALFVATAAGQNIIDGVCELTKIHVTDLNLTAILGTWHQIARINDEVGECSSLTFTGTYDANGELTEIQGTHYDVFNNTKTTLSGPLHILNNGIFSMQIPGFFEGPFVVQAIDYDNFGILYSCLQLSIANEDGTLKDTKSVWAWQYNRKTTLSSTEQAVVQKIVDLNTDLKGADWKFVSHTKAACGDAGMPLATSNVLLLLTILFISKKFI